MLILWCVFLFLHLPPLVFCQETAESLPAETHYTTNQVSSGTAAPPESESTRLAAPVTKDSTAQAANRRDSTVHAMLAQLEQEAALKAQAQEETVSRGEPVQRVSDGIIGSIVHLPQKAGRHRWLALAAAAAAVLSIGALIQVAHRHSKREARRFMTTMRLSLMDSEVQRACLHIEKNFCDTVLSPRSVCAAIITGEPFLEALFEKELGMSISAYINHVRIHRAKLLVTAASETGSPEIAARVGFSDSSEFETQFRLVEGGEFTAYCREKQSTS